MKNWLLFPLLTVAVSASIVTASAAPAAKVVKVAPAPKREPVQKKGTVQKPVARTLTPAQQKRVQAARRAQLEAMIAASNAVIIATARSQGMTPEQIQKLTRMPSKPLPTTASPTTGSPTVPAQAPANR